MVELGSAIMKFGSAAQQSSFLHLATNSIQHFWREDDAGDTSFDDVHCDTCTQAMSLLHLSDCPSAEAVAFRHTLFRRVLQSLQESYGDRNWLHASRRLDLPSLMLKLFPPPASVADAEAIRLHTACCMMGAFSSAEANAAAKTLHFPLSRGRPTPMELFRCLCVDQFSLFYSSRKF